MTGGESGGNGQRIAALENRFRDLAERSFSRNVFTFTGFLSLAEQEVLHRAAAKAGARITLSGGMEYAERQMARFGDPGDLGYEEPFPIVCLCVKPLVEKFSESFTHRDFLGAVLNTGIDRSAVGDIFPEEKRAYLFCTDKIAPWLEENLTQVRHTRVRCGRVDDVKDLPGPVFVYRKTWPACAVMAWWRRCGTFPAAGAWNCFGRKRYLSTGGRWKTTAARSGRATGFQSEDTASFSSAGRSIFRERESRW